MRGQGLLLHELQAATGRMGAGRANCIRPYQAGSKLAPSLLTAHCGSLSAIGNPTGNVVTRYNARYTCIVPRSQVGRALDGPLEHTSRVTVTGLG
nr:hypothetical protein [uncultured bacterium]